MRRFQAGAGHRQGGEVAATGTQRSGGDGAGPEGPFPGVGGEFSAQWLHQKVPLVDRHGAEEVNGAVERWPQFADEACCPRAVVSSITKALRLL
jgi:hypothetical protein